MIAASIIAVIFCIIIEYRIDAILKLFENVQPETAAYTYIKGVNYK